MNLFQLVDRLRVESGASGFPITTVEGNLAYETSRLKKWAQDAWRDIQTMYQWKFLFQEAVFTVPQYASVITPPEFTAKQVADWLEDTVRIAPFGGARKDSQPMMCVDYFDFRDGAGIDPAKRGKPSVISIHPNSESLLIAPSADQQYTLFYDYYREPHELDDNDDVPLMPARFHELIVWEALIRYGGYEESAPVLQRAARQAAPLWSSLMHDQLPKMELASLG